VLFGGKTRVGTWTDNDGVGVDSAGNTGMACSSLLFVIAVTGRDKDVEDAEEDNFA